MLLLLAILLHFPRLSSCLLIAHTVISSPHSPCPVQQCFTLQQFAATVQYTSFNTTLQLTLLPGNHSLASELFISDVDTFKMLSNAKDVWITCIDIGTFTFVSVKSVEIRNLMFLKCGENRANTVASLTIHECTFHSWNESRVILEFNKSAVTIHECTFHSWNDSNAILEFNRSTATIIATSFVSSMLIIISSNVTIVGTTFETELGNVLTAELGSIMNITDSKFFNSTTATFGDNSSLISFVESTVTLENSTIANNKGGIMMYAKKCKEIKIIRSSLLNNFGKNFIFIAVKSNISLQNTIIAGNTGNFSVLYLVKTETDVTDGLIFANNCGPFFIRDSSIVMNGSNSFHGCTCSESYDDNHIEGTLLIFRSTMTLLGNNTLTENHSKAFGGAMYVSESMMFVYNNLTIANNTANDGGGGAYLYQTLLTCYGRCVFSGNRANTTGGGIHAVRTDIILRSESMWRPSKCKCGLLILTDNKAEFGGGLYLEVKSKIYGLENKNYQYSIKLVGNVANMKGGGLFIKDITYSGVCASNSSFHYRKRTECFFQTLYNDEDASESENKQHIVFKNNSAVLGSALYGGLLDRCTVNPSADIYNQTIYSTRLNHLIDAITYFKKESGIDTFQTDDRIASDAVRVCFCQDTMPNCSYNPTPIYAKKGEKFSLTVVAVNQINHTVNATVVSTLLIENTLGEGQQLQSTYSGCTNLTFNISSPNDYADLEMHVRKGPCLDFGISKTSVQVHFNNCTCSIGFQIVGSGKTKCECECRQELKKYVKTCNSLTGSITRKGNSWIGYFNKSGYLVHPNCPYDYCLQPALGDVEIDLNDEDGSNAQCAFDRSGLLCGKCKPGFCLSIASSRCIKVKKNWQSVLFIAGNILAGAFGGIVLVVILLTLNLTVAVGTLNGLIFYANVVLANRNIFLPFMSTNLFTVVVNILNAQLGIDRCFSKDMEVYGKTWLNIGFPLYLLAIVVAIILVSNYSSKCARLIGKRNPVATLATLILLTYTLLVSTVIDILSFTVLKYTEKTHEVVWLLNASIKYFKVKHIPLLVVAILIIVLGLAYTILLFSWQWLLQAPNKKIFKWIRSTKLNSIMEAYHAPYKPKYRYWTGLLLLFRIVLNIAIAANVTGSPKFNLLLVTILVAFLFLIKAYSGDKMYKNSLLDYFESTCLFNLLLFSLVSFYSLGYVQSQKTSAYISISTTLVLLICALLYHIHQTLNELRWYKRICDLIKQRVRHKEHTAKSELHNKIAVTHTFLEVSLLKSLDYCVEDKMNEDEKLQDTSGRVKFRERMMYNNNSTSEMYDSNCLRESLLQELSM